MISQYDKDHPLYLKSKIKALENDILYEEFKIILGLEDPGTLKEKINNNYKKIYITIFYRRSSNGFIERH